MKQFHIFILLYVSLASGTGTETEQDWVLVSPEIIESVSHLNIELPERFPKNINKKGRTLRSISRKDIAPWPTNKWSVSYPSQQGMDSLLLVQAFQYAAANKSEAVVVIRNGYIVGEWYGNGWDQSTRQQGFSVSKSFTGAIIGMLIEDGILTGSDQPVSDFIEEWKGDEHSAITIKHLLSMESGLEWNVLTDLILHLYPNQNKYAISLPMESDPGEEWVYHNTACQVPSEMILQAIGKQTALYAYDRLRNVIGMWTAQWMQDQVGNTLTYMGIIATAREFAKFGYLYLRNGVWDDKQIINSKWVLTSTKPSQTHNPFYGYLWWLNTGGLLWIDVPGDAFAAIGMNERRIYIIPSLDIVAVRLGEGFYNWNDNEFLGKVSAACIEPVHTARNKQMGKLGDTMEIPVEFTLHPNHPNPFNPVTTITFENSTDAHIELSVYNLSGQKITTLAYNNFSSGLHTVTWDGFDSRHQPVGSGIYICSLRSGGIFTSRKMILVR